MVEKGGGRMDETINSRDVSRLKNTGQTDGIATPMAIDQWLERNSIVMRFRLPIRTKYLYDGLATWQKKILKEILIKAVEGLSQANLYQLNQINMLRFDHKISNINIPINININNPQTDTNAANTKWAVEELRRENQELRLRINMLEKQIEAMRKYLDENGMKKLLEENMKLQVELERWRKAAIEQKKIAENLEKNERMLERLVNELREENSDLKAMLSKCTSTQTTR